MIDNYRELNMPYLYLKEDEDNKIRIHDTLVSICKSLGYIFKESNKYNYGTGKIFISSSLVIEIVYSFDIESIYTIIMTDDINCTDSYKDLDNLSVDLQTATMIIDTIHTKLN